MTLARDRDSQQPFQATSRKKPPSSAPVALGILKALDPPRTDVPSHSQKARSEDRFTIHSDSSHRDRDRDREKDLGEKKDKWTFWNRDKDREKERSERERDGARGKDRREDDGQAELTRMIGMIEFHVAAHSMCS